jgi:hypothetical protein
VLFRTTAAGDALVSADRARRHAWFEARLRNLQPEDRELLHRAAGILRGIADS